MSHHYSSTHTGYTTDVVQSAGFAEVRIVSNEHRIQAGASMAPGCERHLALALAELVRTGVVQRDALERMLTLAFDYVEDKRPGLSTPAG